MKKNILVESLCNQNTPDPQLVKQSYPSGIYILKQIMPNLKVCSCFDSPISSAPFRLGNFSSTSV